MRGTGKTSQGRILAALRSLVDALGGPHPRIPSDHARVARQVALIALVHAVFVILLLIPTNSLWVQMTGSPIWRDGDAVVVMAGVLLILAAYGIVRGGWFTAGAALYIGSSTAVAAIAPFAAGADSEIGLLASAVIPVLVTAMAFQVRWAVLVLAVELVAGASQALLLPLPEFVRATALALLMTCLVTSCLILLLRSYYAGLEADHLAQVRATESALRESEGELRALFESSRDMIIVLDRAATPVRVGGAFRKILGHTEEQIVGRSTFEDVHPEDRARVQGALAALVAGDASQATITWRHRHADASWRYLEATANNSLEVPGVNGVVVNVRDVTERREADEQKTRLEAQLQQAMKMESVGRLAGGVAHDFNNLLTALRGNAEAAEAEVGPDHPARAALEEIRQAADRAASLTQQLLAFSRRQVIAPRVIDLNELVRRMESMLARLIGEDVTLRTSLAPALGAVRVDPGLIEQIIMNLAVNSRDAMPEGGALLLETANLEVGGGFELGSTTVQPGPYVLLSVTDNGSGMTEEVLRHAFEPFFTTKEPGKGTGLGLATAYGAVKQSGGYIEVASAPGRGTTVRIFFPRAGEAAEPLGTGEGQRSPGRGRGETVLLVEDEPQVRTLVLRLLTAAGYRVIPAADGAEALDLVADAGPIDLLMTDVIMPGMNGRELATVLRSGHPGLRVLFSSGYTKEVITRDGLLEEGISFLAKPYSTQELLRRVRDVLDEPGTTAG
jgi:two-component system, cell cycle sensor histidine kinase and response regulator CckA